MNEQIKMSDSEREEWNASDAVIQKRAEESERIWQTVCKKGVDAIEGIMNYLSEIEGQNKRLNRRIEMLEKMALDNKTAEYLVALLEKQK